jgi:hypothetical protein
MRGRRIIFNSMLGSILWPLGIGLCLAMLVFVAGVILIVGIFVLASPFAAIIGIRRGVRRYYEERMAAEAKKAEERVAQLRPDSSFSRTRSE